MNHSPAPDWPAPTLSPDEEWSATVRVPGSKSLTNRYLILAAVADAPSEIRGALDSRDSRLMMAALESLGARFDSTAHGLLVTPLSRGRDFTKVDPNYPEVSIDTGLAGTVMRFVPPLAAVLGIDTHFDGDPGARLRPMAPVIEAVRQLGSTVDDSDTGHLPFSLKTTRRPDSEPHRSGSPQHVVIDASASSQFLSALLLVGALLPHGLHVEHRGQGIPSMPHIDMTIATLQEFDIQVEQTGPSSWFVWPGTPRAHDVVVEPDLSNAGPFLAAAVVTGQKVTIPDWPAETTQGGDEWRTILPQFGAEVRRSGADLIVRGPQGGAWADAIPGIDIDLQGAGELAPTVAAIAALSSKPSRLRGIAHLRGHETDRLKALVTEIRRLGGMAEETEDGVTIDAPVRNGALFETYADHRMATAGAVIGLILPDVVVRDVETTSKTLPGFTEMWDEMLASREV